MSGAVSTAAVDILEDQGAVGLTVEITPRETQCTVGCGGEPPGTPSDPLPATGGEPVSIILALALFVAGAVATLAARGRKPSTRTE